jgi:hypothetical protein
VEQLEAIRQQLAADTMAYLQQGGIIRSVPMGQTALDPMTGQTMKAARTFYASSARGSNANKKARAEKSASRCVVPSMIDDTILGYGLDSL